MLVLISLLIFLKESVGVTFQSLYDRQLKSSYGFEILKHYHSEQFGNEDVKKFQGQSMIFMTPWRQNGIPLALKYIKKFDYFVPCYYDLKKQNNSITIVVSQYYNETYLKQIKQANPKIKIIPRVYAHGMQGDVFLLSSTEQEQHQKLLSIFQNIFDNPLYDGVLFGSPFITPNHKYPFSMKNILKDIRKIADIHNKMLMIILDGVNDKPQQKINKKKTKQLIDLVHKIVIANYDYPKGNMGSTIPISPTHWIIENYDFYCEVYSKAKVTQKIIMAIPLYGYFVAMYGKYDPIQGKQFLEKLEKQTKAYLHWNEQIDECMVVLNRMQFIYFPCLHFYDTRLRYFEELGVGVAGFQIGSGLQIFMQMF